MKSRLAAIDVPPGVYPDPDELVQAAMRWHFDPETGSRFWLERARTLPFDPRADVRTFSDLRLFPNVTDELRDVPVPDLIPQGFGSRPDVVSIIESGGTTGPPKRLPLLREFADRMVAADLAGYEARDLPRDRHWLALFPSGPHGALEQSRRSLRAWGVLLFAIDMDPRWVKKQIAAGNHEVVEDYAEHLVDQAAHVLRNQNIGTLRATPPVLARIARRDDLVEIIQTRIDAIGWGGASMDADSRQYYREHLFPDTRLMGGYGTTMALGVGAEERADLPLDGPCIYDPSMAPFVTVEVVDAETGALVDYGERGQLVVHHVSKSFLLPSNLERDTATRIRPIRDQAGDSIADIAPLADFRGAEVIEGVY